MTRIIMHGCNGRMGKAIDEFSRDDERFEIVAGVDINTSQAGSYPVYPDIRDCKDAADVVIDFSRADITDTVLDYCVERKLPLVLCTTGLSEETIAHVERAAGEIPILRSANMSVGINLLMKVLGEVSPVLRSAGFDIEIVEKHHNQKLDAPSGTALALADSINASLEKDMDYVYDRSSRREKRPQNEIGISAVRGGSIVGDHDVIFAGPDEVITFSHRIYSRSVFANGALQAAAAISGRPAGLYGMSDIL